MHKLRVGILRGGASQDYETSFNTGGEILRAMPSHYKAIDIVLDREGNWYHQGLIIPPSHIHKKVDVVFNALHGTYGEDGKVQQLLEAVKVPYTGSSIVPSAFAMHKGISKKLFLQHGIRTPRYVVITSEDIVNDEKILHVFKSLPLPVIIKPLRGNASRGIVLAHSFHELGDVLKQSHIDHKDIIVEEYINGKEATCGVIESFREQPFYTLIPTAIKKLKHFFTHDEKKSGCYTHCHNDLTMAEKKQIQLMAQQAHQILGLRHYSQADFVIHPKRGVFIIEVNSQPTLTPQCLFPQKLVVVGSNLSEFIDHTIQLALRK